ncbi:MAG TPA: envelope stress response membrane protein PspC [Woeseiaceae bacterium]|nr:envelope stress response membrane protein PspC [Woeseiaceae bacterium]
MSGYESMRRRFYRSRDRAVIAGVCAGLADYFGFNLKVTRLLAVIALFMAPPVTLFVYFGTVLLVPAEHDERRRRPDYDPEFRRAVRSSPRETLADVKRRFQALDSRLARLERYVTSSRYDLDQEFKKL